MPPPLPVTLATPTTSGITKAEVNTGPINPTDCAITSGNDNTLAPRRPLSGWGFSMSFTISFLSCVAAGSLELGMSYSPCLSCRPGLAWVRQSGPGLRLGRITPHGVQARATRHVGRPVKPLVAQALVKPCAIAIAGLQIGGQALAV